MLATSAIITILVLSTIYIAGALAQHPESPEEPADSPRGDRS